MGLEAATIMAISAAVSGATAAYGASQANKGGAPTPAAPVAPEPPPASAAEKAPERASMKKKQKTTAGVGAAPAETLLTGPAGVQLDAGILGKNTLLGG
jgi:hypothetical protein